MSARMADASDYGIDPFGYKLTRLLGEGGFGMVFKAEKGGRERRC